MPNWCSNALYVSGDKEKVAAFHKKVMAPSPEGVGLLGTFYPMPDVLRGLHTGLHHRS